MFFRFACAMSLVVLISLAGAVLETESLALRRRVSQQQYQLDMLREKESRLRTVAQQKGTPTRWLDELGRGELALERIAQPQRPRQPRTPLMNWTVPLERDAPPRAD
jgi:hypothetical protein